MPGIGEMGRYPEVTLSQHKAMHFSDQSAREWGATKKREIELAQQFKKTEMKPIPFSKEVLGLFKQASQRGTLTEEDRAELDSLMYPEQKPNPLLQFFNYSHLKSTLQDVSKLFNALAHELDALLPGNPEKTTALRNLLNSKDCAVRALLYKEDPTYDPRVEKQSPEHQSSASKHGPDPEGIGVL